MNRTYTVRPLGMVAWAEGIETLDRAVAVAREVKQLGLGTLIIVDDETGLTYTSTGYLRHTLPEGGGYAAGF